MKKINVGIIGSGFIIPVFISVTKMFSAYHLTAIWGRHEEKLLNFKDDFDYYTTDLEKMLSDENIDVIYVAVPNSLHYHYAMEALKHGKHVFLEKPFTVTYAKAKKLIDYANAHDLILFEGVPNGYNPYLQKAVKKKDKLGNIRLVTANYSQYSRRYDRFKKGEILPAFDKNLAGGALLDLGVYNIRFVITMFGAPKKVEYHPNIEKGVDTSGVLIMDYGDFKATCIAAKDCKADSYVVIEGEDGYLRCNTTSSRAADFTLKLNNGKEEHFFQEAQGEFDSWKYQIKEFMKIYQNMDLEKARQYNELTLIEMRVVDKALKSAGLNYKEEN